MADDRLQRLAAARKLVDAIPAIVEATAKDLSEVTSQLRRRDTTTASRERTNAAEPAPQTNPKAKKQRENQRDSFSFQGTEKVAAKPDVIRPLFINFLNALGAWISDKRGDDAISDIVKDGDTDKAHVLYRTVLASFYEELRGILGKARFGNDFRFVVRSAVRQALDRSVRIQGETYHWDCLLTRQILEGELARLAGDYPNFDKEENEAETGRRTHQRPDAATEGTPESVIEAEFVVESETATETVEPVNEAVRDLMREFLYGRDEDGAVRNGVVEPDAVAKFTAMGDPPPDAETDEMYRDWLYGQLMAAATDWCRAIGTFLGSPAGERLLASLDPPRHVANDPERFLTVAFTAAQIMVAYNQPLDGDHTQEIVAVIDRGDLNDALETL